MKMTNILGAMLIATACFSTTLYADDTDIFLNPTSPSSSTNLLVVIDSAGSINANTTDIDGTSKKVYQVAANVLSALLDPANLSIAKSAFTSTSIVTEGASCNATTVSGCTCTNFGYEVDSSNASKCKLPAIRASNLQLLINSVSLGVMLFNGSNSSEADGAAQKGGYIGYQVLPMSTPDNRTDLIAKLADVPTGNGSMYSYSMYEAYAYFKNLAAPNGFDGSKAYSTTSLQGYDRRACSRPNGVGQSCSAVNYTGPVVADSCRNAILFIGPGSPDNSAKENDTAPLIAVGGASAATVIATGGTPNYDSNMFDEWARYLASADFNPGSDGVQPIATYTIMNDPSPQARAVNFMKSAATQGGGAYYEAKSAVDFLDAFVAVLSKVQSINSAFASVALPVSVNVRGTNLNQVYVGLFRPDASAKPRWFGNMKQYQLAFDSTTNDVFLAGADGLRAETTSAQLLSDTAVSFWTHSSSFWNFDPRGTPKTGNDSPDGSVVEKGGAAQMARDQYATPTLQATRKLYTCINCASNTTLTDATGSESTAFKEGNTALTDVKLAVSGATARTNLINWCRGADDLENETSTTTNDVRASLYGDVLHSRPAVINYNRDTTCVSANNNDVYLFYGANDGFFKATKGGDNSSGNGGKEEWAFIPEELLPRLKRLYDNSPEITAADPKGYFVDGSVGSYIEYASTTCTGASAIRKVSKAWIYLSMRRGGPYLYALDVTPPVLSSSPLVPKVKWKITPSTPGFSGLGDTWSEPKTAKVNIGGVVTPVLIFGGGYDSAVEDIPNNAITSSSAASVTYTAVSSTATVSRTKGQAIYVVNADTGALIWRASNSASACAASPAVCVAISGMDYSIPSDISIVDRDNNGNADRLYFGDTGANLWRANIGDPSTSSWTAYKLGQLNAARGSESATSARRKFLYAPDVVASSAPEYDLVLIGSGDREQPFDTTVKNRFYAIKDIGTVPASPVSDTDSELLEVNASNLATGITLTSTSKGWFYTMTESGEKVVSSPVTLNSNVFFNTNTPRTGCSAGLGEARIYALNFETGNAPIYTSGGVPSAYMVVPGGGYLPTGVPAVVDVGGKLREVLIIGTKVSQDIGVVQLGRRVRTYWYQSIDQKN